MRKAAIALSMVMLAGCATVGSRISQSQMDRIVLGQTTREEVLSVFGPPYSETLDVDGNSVLSWSYAHVGFAGIGTEVQGMAVVINPEGKVVRYSRSGSTPIASAARPTTQPAAQSEAFSQQQAAPGAKSKEQQIYELQQRNLPYEQYQQEYRRIMGQ